MRPSARSPLVLILGLTLVIGVALIAPGCSPERRQITPTTTGSDLRALPRGRMTPLPFPGSSLARVGTRPAPAASRTDPETTLATTRNRDAAER